MARITLKSCLKTVDSNILLPTEIDSIAKLRNVLIEDISFTIFKNTNKRKLQSLKYIPESKGGDTTKFISNFLKLCYNAEINDTEEQKNYLYKSFTMNSYFSKEFYNKTKNANSINELIKGFEDIVFDESNLIKNDSIVALKHKQLGVSKILNSLWKIKFVKELITYSNTCKILQRVKSSNKFLGIDDRFTSPSTNHTEVSSCNDTYHCCIKKSTKTDKLNFYVIMIFNLLLGIILIKKVVCHNERLGGNDEWCIELIKQHILTIDTLHD
ncbi:uncharacterized protein OCT59_024668 [Rhizophagus irregularis]|uniref:uncharacterized protein n=1 Tax=Rhizophagus irregularis TaxID=588596 RepID=UPI00332E4CFE|nr:hypothetical protein OCT59_024668 [Rhizophagus irregularis]